MLAFLQRAEDAAKRFVGNYGRMGWFAIAAAALAVAVVFFAEQQIMVGVWKAALVIAASFAGYWLDRHLFPYARPHEMTADDNNGVWTKFDTQGHVFAACMYRRALIVVGTMIAVAVAL